MIMSYHPVVRSIRPISVIMTVCAISGIAVACSPAFKLPGKPEWSKAIPQTDNNGVGGKSG
jgi:hypothetical protein